MSDNKHDLATEFPSYKEDIHRLKISDSRFRSLMERYHDLNKAIARSEQRIDHLTDVEEQDLRKERLRVKDALCSMLKTTQQKK